MQDENISFISEEARKFHEEFSQCETMEDIMRLEERERKLNEAREAAVIPHLDMTYEEFLEKYHCIDSDELMKKYGF